MNKYNFDKNKWMLYHYDILKRLATQKIEKGKYDGLLKIGYSKNKYNFKKLQIVSSFALLGRLMRDQFLKETAKEQIFLALKFQRNDGYFFTDSYRKKKDYARANVQFLCVEFMNAYFNIKDIFNYQEKLKFKQKIQKSLKYVVGYITSFTEANQLAGALLFMKMYDAEFGGFQREYSRLKENFLDQQLSSGEWYEKWEAPACDILYLSLQLAYLARLTDFDSSKDLIFAIKKGLAFLKNVLLPSGELDLTASKRWIPLAPLGKKFLIYAFAKFYDSSYTSYILKCLKKCDPEDIYYCTKGLTILPDLKEPKELHNNFITKNFAIVYNKGFRLSFGLGPIRISGGQITSIYHYRKGWIIQQFPIGKYDLPSQCNQIRILLADGTTLNSSLDCWANFDLPRLKVMGQMKKEDKKYMATPFRYYRFSDASFPIYFRQEYKLGEKKIVEKVKLFFGDSVKIKKVLRVIPLTNGKINTSYPIMMSRGKGVYEEINLHNIIIAENISIKKGDTLEFTIALQI